jgi:Holliday junction resolvase RusA-like endonuclease
MSDEAFNANDGCKRATTVTVVNEQVDQLSSATKKATNAPNDVLNGVASLDQEKMQSNGRKKLSQEMNWPEYWPKNKKGKHLPLAPKHGFYRPDTSALFSCSNEYIQFTLAGRPQPKERYVTSHNGHKWNPSQKQEEDIAVSIASLCDDIRRSAFFFEHKISLCLTVKFIFGNNNTWHGRPRPDLDNLCKTVMDALNEIVYKDDNQFVDLVAKKRISHTRPDRTVITISKFAGSMEDEEDYDIA